MTGRRATQVLNGPSSRPVRAALADVLAAHGAPAARLLEPRGAITVASQFAACPRCGAALQFPTEQATGRLLEHCDACGFHRAMPRRTAAAVQAEERARFAALVAAEAAQPHAADEQSVRPMYERQGHCARCGALLPPKRMGVRGRRFCKDRPRCLQAAKGRRPRVIARALAFEALRTGVLGALPTTRAAARSVPELLEALPAFTLAQLRRALRALVRTQEVHAAWLHERRGATGGRPPMGYWRAGC